MIQEGKLIGFSSITFIIGAVLVYLASGRFIIQIIISIIFLVFLLIILLKYTTEVRGSY